MTFGTITIALQKEEPFSDFTIRQLRATKGDVSRIVRHFHFTSWPDKDVPAYASTLVHFHRKVLPSMKNSSQPTVVHCSAGVGRTGTFIGLDFLKDQGEKEGSVDIYTCVENLREQRVSMVQTEKQYIFLHTAVFEALNCKSYEMSCADFRTFYKQVCEEESRAGTSRLLEDEFSKLEGIYPCESSTFEVGKQGENKSRNRVQNILPADNERPVLSTPENDSNPYINAVFLPGLRKKRQFIVTQTPLENTTVDFWRMVFEQQTDVLVDLSMDPTVDVFYPLSGEMKIGRFSVACTGVSQLENCQTTIYFLTVTYSMQTFAVTLYRPTFWTDEDRMPSTKPMLRFLTEAGDICESDPNRRVLVICQNGTTKCGVFCVASVSLDHLKVEQEIATGQIIKQFRLTRPQIIQTTKQLKFCYDVLISYLDENETYSNFS